MALRLSDLVVAGEIFNTSWYSVHGWLALRGGEQVVQLQLTGNCAEDLAGWHFRFEAPDAEAAAPEGVPGADDLRGFAWQQVGPTGVMTIKESPAADSSSSAKSKRSLYLEWFSQNGRVVIELDEANIELLEYNDLEANPAGPPRQRADTDDELFDEEFAEFEPESDELDEAMLEDAMLDDAGDLPWDEDLDDDLEGSSWLDDEDEEDPYGLLPDSLKQQFDEAANETDRTLDLDDSPYDAAPWLFQDDEDRPDAIRELELMDECRERGEGELLSDLFDGPLQLPRPDQLGSDAEAEKALKRLLAKLARCGVSLAVCHHFAPRDAYRLLIDEICVGERAYRELQGAQCVQTFMTSEYCPQCEEEFEREYQEYKRRRQERGDEGDDDIPF